MGLSLEEPVQRRGVGGDGSKAMWLVARRQLVVAAAELLTAFHIPICSVPIDIHLHARKRIGFIYYL